MIIALDYDETFTAAPALFSRLVSLAKQEGHTITFVTFRSSKWVNADICADAMKLDIDVVFTEGKQKSHVFQADIWIDDSPVLIPSAEDLGNTYDGCLAMDDMK